MWGYFLFPDKWWWLWVTMTTDHDQQQTVCDMVCKIRAFISNLLSLNRFWWARFYKFTENVVYKIKWGIGLENHILTLIVSDVDVSSLMLQESPDQAMVPLVCSRHQGGPALWGPGVDGHIRGLQQSRHNLESTWKYKKYKTLKRKIKYNLSVTKAGGYN